jgi:hypothetical protein
MSERDGAMCYWRCPNCGQMNFSEEPPDMCDFCQDFTTWQHVTEDAARSEKPVNPSWATRRGEHCGKRSGSGDE